MRPGQLLKVPCGTPAYSAPELVCRQEYDGTLSDVWSLGVLLYFMLVGELPFSDTARIRAGEFARRPELTPLTLTLTPTLTLTLTLTVTLTLTLILTLTLLILTLALT